MTRGNPPWTSWSQWVYLPIETIRRCAMIRRFVDGHFCWWITIASVKLQSVSSSYLSIERVCFDHVKRLANKRDVYKFCHCLRKILVVKWALLLGGKPTTCHSRLSEAVLLKAMNATGMTNHFPAHVGHGRILPKPKCLFFRGSQQAESARLVIEPRQGKTWPLHNLQKTHLKGISSCDDDLQECRTKLLAR